MKKRRYFAGAAAILFLLLLCGFAPQSITEDKDAQVLLYETYGESEILVYTGRTTVLYRPDGRSAEAPFNGQYAVLHGDTVTVFAETEEFLAVERFSAETLEETDLFALPVTSGLRFAESDSAGRLYAVTYGAPSTLQVFDAAGEPLTEFIFEDKIFGIQTVDSTLYVLLSESAVQISLAGNVPTLSGTAFTYAPAARPYKLLGSDVYVNMQGEVRLFSGEEWVEDTIDLSVRALAAQALRIGLLAEPLYGVSIVAAGALRGTGDTFVPSMMNLGSIWVVRIGLALLLVGN